MSRTAQSLSTRGIVADKPSVIAASVALVPCAVAVAPATVIPQVKITVSTAPQSLIAARGSIASTGKASVSPITTATTADTGSVTVAAKANISAVTVDMPIAMGDMAPAAATSVSIATRATTAVAGALSVISKVLVSTATQALDVARGAFDTVAGVDLTLPVRELVAGLGSLAPSAAVSRTLAAASVTLALSTLTPSGKAATAIAAESLTTDVVATAPTAASRYSIDIPPTILSSGTVIPHAITMTEISAHALSIAYNALDAYGSVDIAPAMGQLDIEPVAVSPAAAAFYHANGSSVTLARGGINPHAATLNHVLLPELVTGHGALDAFSSVSIGSVAIELALAHGDASPHAAISRTVSPHALDIARGALGAFGGVDIIPASEHLAVEYGGIVPHTAVDIQPVTRETTLSVGYYLATGKALLAVSPRNVVISPVAFQLHAKALLAPVSLPTTIARGDLRIAWYVHTNINAVSYGVGSAAQLLPLAASADSATIGGASELTFGPAFELPPTIPGVGPYRAIYPTISYDPISGRPGREYKLPDDFGKRAGDLAAINTFDPTPGSLNDSFFKGTGAVTIRIADPGVPGVRSTAYRTKGNTNTWSIRMNVRSPAGQPWWHNTESTWYIRAVSFPDYATLEVQRQYPHFVIESRGERHGSGVLKSQVNDGNAPMYALRIDAGEWNDGIVTYKTGDTIHVTTTDIRAWIDAIDAARKDAGHSDGFAATVLHGTETWPWWDRITDDTLIDPHAMGTAMHGSIYVSYNIPGNKAGADYSSHPLPSLNAEKEITHTEGYAGKRAGYDPTTGTHLEGVVPAGFIWDAGDLRGSTTLPTPWVGVKSIVRSDPLSSKVAIEVWLDRTADNRWERVFYEEDTGDWTANNPNLNGLYGDPYDLQPGQLISWAAPWVGFRADSVEMDFRDLSVREIEPLDTFTTFVDATVDMVGSTDAGLVQDIPLYTDIITPEPLQVTAALDIAADLSAESAPFAQKYRDEYGYGPDTECDVRASIWNIAADEITVASAVDGQSDTEAVLKLVYDLAANVEATSDLFARWPYWLEAEVASQGDAAATGVADQPIAGTSDSYLDAQATSRFNPQNIGFVAMGAAAKANAPTDGVTSLIPHIPAYSIYSAPTVLADGDLLILHITSNDTCEHIVTAKSPYDDWEKAFDFQAGTPDYPVRTSIWYRRVLHANLEGDMTAEGAAVQPLVTKYGGNATVAYIAAYRNVYETGFPFDIYPNELTILPDDGDADTSGTQLFTGPTITTIEPGEELVHFVVGGLYTTDGKSCTNIGAGGFATYNPVPFTMAGAYETGFVGIAQFRSASPITFAGTPINASAFVSPTDISCTWASISVTLKPSITIKMPNTQAAPIYKTKTGGREWYLPQDTGIAGQLSVTLNNDDIFQPDTKNIIVLEPGVNGKSTVYRSPGTSTQGHSRFVVKSPDNTAWWRNVEATGYFRAVSFPYDPPKGSPYWFIESHGERWAFGTLGIRSTQNNNASKVGESVYLTALDGNIHVYRVMSGTAPAQATPSGDWRSVAYNGKKYWAVATDNIMYSTDGIVWATYTNVNLVGAWKAIATNTALVVNGTRICLVGPQGAVISASGTLSTSGFSKMSVPAAQVTAGGYTAVTYGPSRFVAVGPNNNIAQGGGSNSTLAAPTTLPTIAPGLTTNNWTGVACNGVNRFVAIGTNCVATSTSSVASVWNPAQYLAGNWTAIIWTGTQFVAIGNGILATSPDGIAWTAGTMPVGAWENISYGNGHYVVVGGGKIITSTNLTSWHTATTGNIHGICWSGLQFQAVGTDQASYSADGDTWTDPVPTVGSFAANMALAYSQIDVPTPTYSAVARANGRLIAVGPNNTIAYKTGATGDWIPASVLPLNGGNWNGVAAGSTCLCAVGTNQIAVSDDLTGNTWYLSSSIIGDWKAVVWAGNEFYAVGNGLAARSRDGQIWNYTSIPSGDWQYIAYGVSSTLKKSIYVAMGPNGTIASTDGITWSQPDMTVPDVDLNWTGITWSVSSFYRIGGGKWSSSEDGVTWSTSIASNSLCTNPALSKGGLGHLGFTDEVVNDGTLIMQEVPGPKKKEINDGNLPSNPDEVWPWWNALGPDDYVNVHVLGSAMRGHNYIKYVAKDGTNRIGADFHVEKTITRQNGDGDGYRPAGGIVPNGWTNAFDVGSLSSGKGSPWFGVKYISRSHPAGLKVRIEQWLDRAADGQWEMVDFIEDDAGASGYQAPWPATDNAADGAVLAPYSYAVDKDGRCIQVIHWAGPWVRFGINSMVVDFKDLSVREIDPLPEPVNILVGENDSISTAKGGLSLNQKCDPPPVVLTSNVDPATITFSHNMAADNATNNDVVASMAHAISLSGTAERVEDCAIVAHLEHAVDSIVTCHSSVDGNVKFDNNLSSDTVCACGVISATKIEHTASAAIVQQTDVYAHALIEWRMNGSCTSATDISSDLTVSHGVAAGVVAAASATASLSSYIDVTADIVISLSIVRGIIKNVVPIVGKYRKAVVWGKGLYNRLTGQSDRRSTTNVKTGSRPVTHVDDGPLDE